MASSRILFITPPTDITAQLMPDLGVGFIASALRENLYHVDFMDVRRDGATREDIARKVRDNDYLFVGVKVFSPSIAEANKVMAAVREASPGVKIVIGGPHPTYAPEHALLSCPDADIAVIGEGDDVAVKLAKHFEKGGNLADMEAIVYREGGGIKINPKKSFVNLENLPVPAWDLMDPRLYRDYEHLWFFSKGNTIANISISRGCPFKCTFCSDFIVSGRQVRYRKIDDVVEEINRLKGVYGVDEIHLTDSIFTVNRRYVYEFCETLIRKDIRIHWATPYGTRLDTMDAGMLRAMEEAGCYGTSVGIESGSERMLKFMKKQITRELVEEKLALIKKTTSFLVQGFFILGFPTETRETMRETIDFACRLPLDMAVFAPFRITPGTEVAAYVEEHEPESRPDWGNQTVEKINYTPKGITLEELERWHRKAYRAFYFRPSVMWKYLKMVKGKKQLGMLAGKFRKRIFRRAGGI